MSGTLWIAIIGAVTGAASLLLHWNYRRDSHNVVVELQWNANLIQEHGMNSPAKQRFGHIIVTNKGRRPVHITYVGLQLPGHPNSSASWIEQGSTLNEGDPSLIIKIPQDSILERFIGDWKKIYARASTNTGHRYKSKPGWERPIIVPGYDFSTMGRFQDFTDLRRLERDRSAATSSKQ